MREMKDSGIEWIGEIPKEWEVVPIKYVKEDSLNSFVDGPFGSNLKSCHYVDDGDVYVIESGFISTGKFIFKDFKTITFEHFSTIKRSECKNNDVIIAKIGANYGMAGILPALDKPSVVSGNSLKLTLDAYKMDNMLFVWQMEMSKKNGGFVSVVNETAQPALSLGILNNYRIILPSPKEQKIIVDYLKEKLSEIDATAEDIQKEISLLEEYKKSVITEAVTKGLNPDAEMKDSGIEWIGEIPKHWKVARLKHVLSEAMKYGANETGVEYSSEMPRYIRITDISLDGKLKDTGKLSLPNNVAKEYILKDKAILFARSGATVGKTFIYKSEYGKMAFAGYLISAYCNEKLFSPELLYYFTNSFAYSEWINRVFSQSTIQNIGADKYVNMILTVPKIAEQQQIVSYLDTKCSEIDTLIADKKRQLDIFADYKKSLIYEYVTGKKEVPVNE